MDGSQRPGKASLVKEGGVMCVERACGSSWLKPWGRRGTVLDTAWPVTLLALPLCPLS